MAKVDSLKDLYRMRFEYLKRNSEYQDYCGWLRRQRKNPKLPMPKKFLKDKNGTLAQKVILFLNYHDISDVPFEEYWCWIKEQRINFRRSPASIVDWSEGESVRIDLIKIIDEFTHHWKREPSLQEFKEEFIRKVKNSTWPIHLKIYLYGDEDIDELSKKFRRIITRKKQTLNIVKRRGFSNLQRYLDVYDGFERDLTWRQIADIIPEYKKRSLNTLRENSLIQMRS
ncbi:MAG: hypothetical protein KKH04_05890 [Proteobacteria bacterium]|nr:hypothetical protein [Pseudomonadota bacterium]